jgi:microcystin-dependent protein
MLPFCPTDTGTNLESQATYAADSSRTNGNQPGIASSKLINKAIRQATWIASQFAQYVVNTTGLDVLDDQNSTNLQAALLAALVPAPNGSQIQNLGMTFSVAGNAATIAIKTQALANASATSPINLAVRSATINSGTFNLRTITGALSATIASGATLGQTSGSAAKIYVYLIDNAGTLEVAVSGTFYSEDQLITTTSLSSSSNSAVTMYSSTGRTNVPFRLVGYILNTQATAGTWVTTASQIQLYPFPQPNATPSGIVSPFAGSAAPSGWLMCDGSVVSRTTYASLFAVIGTTFGVGDGSTTFGLPNTAGLFLRGAGTQSVSGISHSTSLGSIQNDQMQGHKHQTNLVSASSTYQPYGFGGSLLGIAGGSNVTANTSYTDVPVTDGTNGTPRTGTETRPANIGMNYIIKT